MIKSKKTLVVISILVILIILGILYFVFWKDKRINDDMLTEEQKAAIIKELTPDSSSKLITDSEKKQAEKDLVAGSDNVEPLTESEINTITNVLN